MQRRTWPPELDICRERGDMRGTKAVRRLSPSHEPYRHSIDMNTLGDEPSMSVRSRSVYAAPRRYDLATMFVVSVAYAVLFSVMRLLQAGPLVFVITGLFFTAIAAAQALLFKGNAPRLASCIAGSLYFA